MIDGGLLFLGVAFLVYALAINLYFNRLVSTGKKQ